MKEKKIIILSSVILGVLVLTLGVTFAVFTFNKTSSNSKLVVGDIYMHYKEANDGITLTNQMPSDTYDSNIFFEFTIDGKNTYEKNDIYYELLLNLGDDLEGKTRIKNNLLKFRLTEIASGVETEIFTDKSYDDLTNKRIHVETIPKNTLTEIKHTYRLYMWISNDTKICSGELTTGCDYYINGTTPNWSDVFASIKVGATGDFNEKVMPKDTDASCFKTEENEDGTLKITGYYTADAKYASLEFQNPLCGTDIIIPEKIDGKKVTVIGTIAFFNKNLSSVVLPNSIIKMEQSAFYVNQLTSIIIPDSVTEIGNAAFSDNQLTSVVIPDSVTTIGDFAFSNNQLTSVVIPDSVTTIAFSAFSNNQLKSVTIGSGIMYIGKTAFLKNSTSNSNLESITINKSCSDIKNIRASSGSTTKYYPWTGGAAGVTMYGLNEEVCDSY